MALPTMLETKLTTTVKNKFSTLITSLLDEKSAARYSDSTVMIAQKIFCYNKNFPAQGD